MDTKERKRQRDREYAAAHREEAKARASAWYYANIVRAKESQKKWNEANKDKKSEQAKRHREINSEAIRAYDRERNKTDARRALLRKYSKLRLLRTPDQARARGAVGNAVRKGVMPPAKNLLCNCGAKASGYHHHLGYARVNWLDVIPVCTRCHARLK